MLVDDHLELRNGLLLTKGVIAYCGVQKLNDHVDELAGQAHHLQELVGRFKIS